MGFPEKGVKQLVKVNSLRRSCEVIGAMRKMLFSVYWGVYYPGSLITNQYIMESRWDRKLYLFMAQNVVSIVD